MNADSWGDYWTFEGQPRQTTRGRRLREELRNGTMPLSVANKRIAAIDADRPYTNGDDFIEDIAALTAVHWSEVDVKTHMQGRKLYDCLYNITVPSRVQLYLNNIRVRHSLTGIHRQLHTAGHTDEHSNIPMRS